MLHIKLYRTASWILLGIIVLLLSACGEAGSAPTPTLRAGVEIDPVFREFYSHLGGEALMGIGLLPAEERDGVTSQYTEAGLMVNDPKLPVSQQLYLAPLGHKLSLPTLQDGFPEQAGAVVVDGFIIYSKFVDLYHLMDMTRFAGRPLSQPMADAESGRIVQYFENVGYYTSLTDPKDGVHLLSYGGADCAERCQYQPVALNSPLEHPAFDEPFLDSLKRIGLDLVGRPLTGFYRTPDGMIEQVYDNVVIYAPADNLRLVSLRPLPVAAGFPATPLVTETVGTGLVFIALDHDPSNHAIGHNVAQVFEQFISTHGGAIIAGSPTTEIFSVGDIYRQCFTNYCLDFNTALPDGQRVHPAALGKAYSLNNPPDQAAQKRLTLSPDTILLTTTEKKAAIAITEGQEIDLTVVQREDQSPVPNLAATVTISLPDGQKASYPVPATDAQGNAQVTINPILAANGTIIPFQVCLNLSTGSPVCAEDTFVIWTP